MKKEEIINADNEQNITDEWQNDFEGEGKRLWGYIEKNVEIKRVLQGAILAFGINNMDWDYLMIDKQKAWSFVFEDNSNAFDPSEVRHIINSLRLDDIITMKIGFEYKFE